MIKFTHYSNTLKAILVLSACLIANLSYAACSSIPKPTIPKGPSTAARIYTVDIGGGSIVTCMQRASGIVPGKMIDAIDGSVKFEAAASQSSKVSAQIKSLETKIKAYKKKKKSVTSMQKQVNQLKAYNLSLASEFRNMMSACQSVL